MRKLLYFAIGACLAATAGFAGAYFTGQVEVKDNLIKGGSVAISAEPTSSALSIEALAPGSSVTRPLSVVNDGNLPVTVVVTAVKKAGITDFFNALTCRVTLGGTLLYEGPLAALKTSPVPLPAGGNLQLQCAVGLPETVGNDLDGDYAKVSLYVDAEQVH